VEAAGVEPASENIRPRRLHIFPDYQFSPIGYQPGRSTSGQAWKDLA